MQTIWMLAMITLLQRTLCSEELHFSQPVYSVTVNETFLPEYPRPAAGFLTLLCVTPHPPVTYSIDYPDNSSTSLPFEINSTTGELTAIEDVDYDSHSEGVDLYSFNVSCSDAVNMTTALVEVHVHAINEFQPDIDPSLVLNITEATPSGTLLLSSLPGGLRRLVVEDMDSGPHGELHFTLLTPLDDHFSFDPLHANLTLARAVDFETESSLSNSLYHQMAVKIRVCDATTPTKACPTIHFPIFIIASDDNEPMFLNNTYTVTLSETTDVGTSLLELVCSDADIHIGEVRAISMLDPPQAVQDTFSLGHLSCNGSIELLLSRELDYDGLDQTYQFQVSCRDLLHSTTANVSISVLPENDEIPIFTSTQYQFSATQTTPTDTRIGQVRAVDRDIDSGLPISYAILRQRDNSFRIDPNTGEIKVNSSLRNLTASTTVLLTIAASDGDWETLANVTVNILSGNFHSPNFLQENLTVVMVNDLISIGVRIIDLTCTDQDMGEAGNISYSFTSAYTTFSINPVTGVVTATRSLLLPSNNSGTQLQEYQLAVQCRDNGVPYLADEIVVIVEVYRSDVAPPHFINVSRIEVREGATVGHEIVHLTASDADTSALNFTIINQTVHGAFLLDMIETNSSVLRVASPLDYEETAVHHVTVEVVEVRLVPGEPQRDVIQLTIHVVDVNDNAPQFTDPFLESISVQDTTPPGHSVHSVECTDEDTGNNGDIVYEILPQHHLFAVDSIGNILVSIPLTIPDFTLSETHNLSVQCRDKAIPPLASNKTLRITINKLDTQPPVVNLSNTSISLPEDLPSGAHVLTLSVYDVDSLNVSIVILNQTLPGTFALSPPSTPYNHPHYPQLTLNGTVDREHTSTHYIELLASSQSSTVHPQNTSFSLTITVQDINDNPPNCSNVKLVITAGFHVHRDLLTLSCSDPDEGLNQQLTYRMDDVIPSLSDGHFSINRTSGELSLEGGIAEGRYDITAVVADQGIPQLHTSVHIEVEVTEDDGNNQRVSLGIVIILVVVVMLVLVGVASGCGLCCCYWCRIRANNKRKQYFVSTSVQPVATSNMWGGVTVISRPTFSDSTSVISHTLVPVVEDTDGTDGSIDEVTITFNPGSEMPSSPLSEFLDDQWPLHAFHRTASLSSFKEDLAQQLETSVTTFKGADWQATPPVQTTETTNSNL